MGSKANEKRDKEETCESRIIKYIPLYGATHYMIVLFCWSETQNMNDHLYMICLKAVFAIIVLACIHSCIMLFSDERDQFHISDAPHIILMTTFFSMLSPLIIIIFILCTPFYTIYKLQQHANTMALFKASIETKALSQESRFFDTKFTELKNKYDALKDCSDTTKELFSNLVKEKSKYDAMQNSDKRRAKEQELEILIAALIESLELTNNSVL